MIKKVYLVFLSLVLIISSVAFTTSSKEKPNVEIQKIEYFFNEPDEENGWIDFMLHKRTQLLIDMGYGKFAQTAGILEDEYKNI